MTSSSAARAEAIGPAAAAALAPGVELRVRGVFARAVSLEVSGAGEFVALTGPEGCALPHAVALGHPPDFAAWGLAPGAAGRCGGDVLSVAAAGGPREIDLSRARRPAPRPLPAVGAPGIIHEQCVRRLAELQEAARTDLRFAALDALHGAAPPPTPLGRTLTAAARALACAAPGAVPAAAAALAGLGPGLTPAGDDFLAGQLAGARAAGHAARAEALAAAILASAARTTALSAFLLRCAVRDLWPGPLADLAAALAAGRAAEALGALEALCAIGHSSGADLATGFLAASGLGRGLGEPSLEQRPPARRFSSDERP